MKKIKFFLFILIFIVLLLPVLQKIYPIIKLNQLGGAFTPTEKPVFSTADWFSEKYQQQYNKYLEENIGFHEFLVKLHNTLDFVLFKKANVEGVVTGKKNYMFEEDYILEYNGYLFIGKTPIERKVRQIKFLQDYLKKNFNIDFIPIFEPGKASFFPEFIPDRYHPEKNVITNYKYYIECCNKYKIRFIDMNSWFMTMKSTSKYPLFPQYGIHWSTYGAILAMDSLSKFIENCRNINMPDIIIKNIKYTDSLQGVDYDLGKSMNLLYQMPTYKMAYPEITFLNNKTKTKPSVLVIGDSFYFQLLGEGKILNLFTNDHSFWCYNAEVFPDYCKKETKVEKLDLKKEIEKQDVIFAMCTERFLHMAFWNFTENLYKIYYPNYFEDNILVNENAIRRVDPWFKNLVREAHVKNIPTEEWIRKNAEYVFTENFTKTTQHTKTEWMTYYKLQILNDQSKKDLYEREAKKLKVNLDEIIVKEIEKKYNDEVLTKK